MHQFSFEISINLVDNTMIFQDNRCDDAAPLQKNRPKEHYPMPLGNHIPRISVGSSNTPDK